MTYLKNHQVLSSRDLHQTRALLADLNCIDALDIIGTGVDVVTSVHTVAFSDLNFIHASFGNVRLQIQAPESNNSALFLLAPTSGNGTVNHCGQDHDISTMHGLMRDMRKPLDAFEEKFATLGVQLPLQSLQRHCRSLIDDVKSLADIEFDTGLDFRTPGGRHVRETLHYIASALDNPLQMLNNAIILNGLRDLLLTNILMLLPNSCTDMLHNRPQSTAIPRHVKRARDYIHAHAAMPITLDNLVQHAGCSYRTLQAAFNAAYGMSPMAYVKSVRMTHAHNDLLAAETGVTVADIALKWGFIHLGRFAKNYARQFGALPSETLRQKP